MKIAVIGAGIAGLSAACELAKDGHLVEVFEQNSGPGGKMHEISIDGFRFDTGPSLFTMPFIAEHLFRYCGYDIYDFIELVNLDPLCRYYFQDGTHFDSYTDREKAVKDLSEIDQQDAAEYVRFLDYSAKLYDRTAQSFLYNPLADFKDVRSLNFIDMLRIDAFTTVSDRVDRSFRHPHIRQFFKRFTTYNGSDPWQAPATLNVIPHVELSLGGYYIKGGMFRLAEALVQLAKKLGVTFHFSKGVTSLHIEDKIAKGILVDGNIIAFDLIVSNADATDTYTRLISDDVIDKQSKIRLASVEPSCSGFVILLGIDRKYDQLAHHTIFFSSDYKSEFTDIFKHGRLPDDPTIYVADTSLSDSEHAPEDGSNLFILVNAPWVRDGEDLTQSAAEHYADKVVLKLAEHGLRGLSAATVVRSIITPNDFMRRWGSNRGSIYGTSSNHRLSAFVRPRNRSPFVRNLYLAGGSTHPGGGIPLVMLSARHACTLIRRDFSGSH